MHVAFVCVALLALLLFGLGFAVSLKRGGTNVIIGHPSDPADPLHKLVRAHGNTAEYAPMLAALMLALAFRSPPTWTLGCMIAATACRYLLAVGMLASPTLAKPHPLRFVGAAGTYLTGIALAVAVLL